MLPEKTNQCDTNWDEGGSQAIHEWCLQTAE
jgi:hypothetical protein